MPCGVRRQGRLQSRGVRPSDRPTHTYTGAETVESSRKVSGARYAQATSGESRLNRLQGFAGGARFGSVPGSLPRA